jgi:hypothetical protein
MIRARGRVLRTSSLRALGRVLALTLGLASTATGVVSQVTPEDSTRILEELHDLQEEFERYRESRTPVERERVAGCDENIGRICIWFGGENEDYPAEFREVRQARVQLIRTLSDAFEQVPDSWILGQWVHYLVEGQSVDEAKRVANQCGVRERWWCSALLGYATHVRTQYVEAEEAFRKALNEMPDDERRQWTSPHYIISKDAEEAFNEGTEAERDARFELFWRLSDPLFLFEGNDRLTDHFARLVEARNREDAAEPLGLEWGDDMAETLIRYGRNTGYSRSHDPARMFNNGFGDTRRMQGHHHPMSRGYLFPEAFLESPSDIPPESWITAPREARTWYAPPYAPDIRGLETQIGRFRRDGQMLVVGAYRPTVAAPNDADDMSVVSAWSREGGISGPANAGLFLIPEDGRDPLFVRGADAEGVLTIRVRPGRYVSGLEVVDAQGRRAWRARQGVVQRPLIPGMVDVSDLLLLTTGAPLPESLEEALPTVRPGIRMKPGERFPVVWEVYGLGILEPVRVTIGFSRGRPGFLSRVGDFLGVIEPEGAVEITFDDTGPDRMQSIFRSIELELPDLDPGEYTLHLQLELSGRTPVVTSRPIIVER